MQYMVNYSRLITYTIKRANAVSYYHACMYRALTIKVLVGMCMTTDKHLPRLVVTMASLMDQVVIISKNSLRPTVGSYSSLNTSKN